jgi:hypothetical protein
MVKDANGQIQIFRVDYQLVDIQSQMCSTIGNPPPPCNEDVGDFDLFIQKLTLPTGKAYIFTYNNNSPGELARVDIPTGGFITYTYNASNFAQPTPPGPPGTFVRPTIAGRRGVAVRTVNVGGNSFAWTYTNQGTVQDPVGNTEVHGYSILTDGTHSSATEYETSVTYKDSAGNVLRTIARDYAFDLNPTDATLIDGRTIRETTTLDNGMVSKVETDYETFTYSLGTATRMNPTEVREYAYGQGAAGPLLRRTTYSYLHNSNPTYTNLNIVDKPTVITVYDGSNNQVAQTTYEYDV